jgi:hypothetical protein
MARAFRLFFLLSLPIMGLRAQTVSHESLKLYSDFAGVPFYFEQNRGQASREKLYVGHAGRLTASLTNAGVTLALDGQSLSMHLAGANPEAQFSEEDPVAGISNYYFGSQTMTGILHYAKVRCHDILPGIDIVYYGRLTELEYDLVLHPGSDPRAVRFHFSGEHRLELDSSGDLLLTSGNTELRQRKPRVWQGDTSHSREVECRYEIQTNGEVALVLVGAYDHSAELTIDPILSFSTYLGGNSIDNINGIAVDSSGVYVVGSTHSTNFPVTAGLRHDATGLVVTKLNLTGTNLIYSTVIADGSGEAIALDSGGNAYVTGAAGGTFPNNVSQPPNGGAFAMKLNSTGTIAYSTVLGGNQGGEGRAIAVDPSGAAYIAGATYSSDFPATPSAFRTTFSGVTDAFVVKFSPTGQLAYATYLGGSDFDEATAITLDSFGNAYVAGRSRSTNFPTTPGAYSTTLKGNDDAFIAVLDPTLSHLLNSTLLGGTSADKATGLARDSVGNLYVTGTIDTSVGTGNLDFPTTPGAFVQDGVGSPRMFMAKFNSSLSTLQYCGRIGGMISSAAIAVDLNGFASLVGTTYASNVPTTVGALQTVPQALSSIYLIVLSPAGDTLSYATLLGGTGGASATSLALDGSGAIYITGVTGGVDFPTTAGVFQPTPPKIPTGTTGGSGFVTKIDLNSPTQCVTNLSSPSASIDGIGGAFAFRFTRPAGCPWFVRADTLGVTVTSQTFGVGAISAMPVSGTVPPNPDIFPRTIQITVAEKAFTINQAGASCQQPVVSPLSLRLDSSGAPLNVNVVLPSVCTWTPTPGAQWLAIGGLGPFSSIPGSRTLTLSATPFAFSQRATTLTITPFTFTQSASTPQTFTVTQTGSGTCTATALATQSNVGNSGGTGEIRLITSGSSCAWDAFSLAPWIQLAATAGTGQGNGAVPYTVAANPGILPRSGQVLIADQVVTINQAAGPAGVVTGYTASIVAQGENPNSVFFDSHTGNLYFSDLVGVVSVVTPDGTVATVAGGGTQTGENIPAKSAQILSPTAVIADSSGTIYFGGPARIWKVSQGLLSTFAGNGTPGFGGDNGPATGAEMTSAQGIVADTSNTFYFSDLGNKRIRKVSGGTITTFAGGGTAAASDGQSATNVALAWPTGVTLDGAGDILFTDLQTVRKVSHGIITTVPILGATLFQPQSLAFDPQGNLLIADFSRLLKRAPDGSTTVVALPQQVGGALGVTDDPSGNLYVANGHAVWKLTPLSFCGYSISQPSIQSGPAGGATNISVTTQAGCNWTVTSDLPWVTISSGSSGAGNGNVQITVASNPGMHRAATIAVAGQAIPVTQPGASDVTMTLSTNKLNFGTSGSMATSPQSVTLSLTNGTAVPWTASSSQPNVTISPASGSGSAVLHIMATSGASAVVTIAALGATNSPQQLQVNVTNATPSIPFGSFDTPVNNTTGIAGAIPVTGWVLDNIEVTSVGIYREPVGNEPTQPNGLVYIGNGTFVAGARPDVEGTYPNAPLNYRAGWGYSLLTNFLPGGNGTFNLHAIATNKAGQTFDLGTRTITVDNAHASKPFGTIDTPDQGATAAGSAFVNFGWSLTQNPRCIPVDGSTIFVYLDSVAVGHPSYNHSRSDVASLFPGLCNSNGAIGFYYIDTTKLANGVHTISWSVTDNAGHSDGVGSRYFTVLNTGTGPIASPDEPDQVPAKNRDVKLRRGFYSTGEAESVSPDKTGEYLIHMEELERIELQVGASNGYLMANGERRPLPIGSTLKDGAFYWQAAQGFLGEYDLLFERQDVAPTCVRVAIHPKSYLPTKR